MKHKKSKNIIQFRQKIISALQTIQNITASDIINKTKKNENNYI